MKTIIWIDGCAVWVGSTVYYRGEPYTLASVGRFGCRIERGDCVLFVHENELKRVS